MLAYKLIISNSIQPTPKFLFLYNMRILQDFNHLQYFFFDKNMCMVSQLPFFRELID